MRPLSRRRALQLGGAGLLSVLVGGAGLTWQLTADPSVAGGGERLAEPATVRSADGLLEVELTAAESRVRLAGRQATVLAYSGGLPGPTLRLRPGDVLRVRLVNELSEPTNLHVHGLVVSPRAQRGTTSSSPSTPGETFDYEYRLPEDHPPGRVLVPPAPSTALGRRPGVRRALRRDHRRGARAARRSPASGSS